MPLPIRNSALFGALRTPLAFGQLQLCGEGAPAFEKAVELIHAALDQGIRLLDTADSYCLDNTNFHFGETLAHRALTSWHGPQEEVRILTKVGLVRPNGRWVPNGSPKHIFKSVDESLKSLETDRLFLLQLHVKDSRVPFEETLGALAELKKIGKVEHIGLCNVGPAEVRQAMRHFAVATVQCELGVQARKAATDGMLVLTQDLGIPFLAYRPLGGRSKVGKLEKNRVLGPIATKHKTTPYEIAIAAVLHSAPHVIPLFGATQSSNIHSSVRSARIELDDSDRAALNAKYSFDADADAIASIRPAALPTNLPQLQPDQGPSDTPEVVLLMGIQGAGKSELVQAYEDRGYARLNRDLLGGKVDNLNGHLQQLLAQGVKRVVLDNTYPTRVSRAGVVRVSHAAGLPVRCRFLETSIDDARINVVMRVLDRYDRLLGPADMKELAKEDPNLPPPIAMQRWQDSLEPPEFDEGFSAIDRIAFVRRPMQGHTNRGLFLDADGTIRTTLSGEIYPRSASDVIVLPNRREVLSQWIDQGYQLFFVSNQSGVASGKLSQADADAAFQRTVDLLGLPVTEVTYCPHPAFPVGCFCRKPMPGLGIYLARKYRLDLSQCKMVGDMDSDAAFAKSIGVQYFDANEFFGS